MPNFFHVHRPVLGGSLFVVLALASAIFVSWHGVMGVPIQIGAVVDGLGFSERRSGILGTAEITAVALVAMLLAAKIDSWPKPRLALIGAIMAIIGQFLSAFVTADYYLLMLFRILVGCGAGLIYGAACASVSGSASGDKLFAWGVSLGQVLVAALLFGLPFAAEDYGQHKGVFITLGVLSIAFTPLLIHLLDPKKHDITPERNTSVSVSVPTIVLYFTALTLFNVAIGMIWSYIERRADELHMDAGQVGLILAALPIGGVIGSMVAGIIGHRFGRLKPFIISLSACTLACFIVGLVEIHVALLLSIFLLGGCELFVMSFFIGTATSMDDNGRMATLAGGMTLLTYGFGPAVGGLLSGFLTVSQICITSGIFCLIAAAIQLPVGMQLDGKKGAIPTPGVH